MKNRKFRLLCICLFLSVSVFCQDNAQPNVVSRSKYWSVGANFSADYCYRTLDSREGSSYTESYEDFREDRETAKFGYTTGINVAWNCSDKMSIEGGFQYSNKGYEFDVSGITFGDMIDPRYGFIYAGPAIRHIYYFFNYLDIPMRVVFTPGNKKIGFAGSAGITTNILLKGGTVTKSEFSNGDSQKSVMTDKQNIKRFNLSPFITLGINYKLNKKLNLRMETAFRYGLFHTSYQPVTQYLWNAGMNMSCYYNFVKAN